MNSLKALWPALAAILASGAVGIGHAQMPAGGPPGWNAAMIKLFGDVKAFSAKAEMRALDKSGRPAIQVPMSFALLENKVRMDIDMTLLKGPQAPPDQIALLKQMAMDRVACIVSLDKKAMQLIFPSLAAYVETPMTEDEAAALNKDLKLHKTPLAKETIDGHPCVKNRVVMTDGKGLQTEALVWNATDMKDFPVQMQLNDKETTVVMRYNEVRLSKPDAKKFDTPAGFTRHTDMQQLMIAIAQKQNQKSGRSESSRSGKNKSN
jgi:hypothetical protein